MKRTFLRNHQLPVFALALLFAFLAPAAASAAPPLPGAIFTTLVDGTRVNANLYEDVCDVYLDGGPGPNAPADAAGLPDGDYYFQVTDPSGKKLLSTDPVANRQFEVSGGIIIGLSGAGDHETGLDIDWGAITIRLCPYDDTPNPGGVYKVWATPVEDFVGDPTKVDNGYSPGYFHGFLPAASKTDNFKVKRGPNMACLRIIKFYDCDNDGVWDEGESTQNWPVTVTDPSGAQIGGTLYTPVELCNLAHGDYIIEESLTIGSSTYKVTATILDGTSLPPSSTVLVEIKKADRELIFGNRVCGCGCN